MKKKLKIYVPLIAVAVIMVIYCARLIQWQVVDYQDYSTQAEDSTTYTRKVTATRGDILDSNGNVLVTGTSSYNVVMDALKITGDRNPALANLVKYMKEWEIDWVSRLPIELNLYGDYSFKENSEASVEYLVTGFLSLDENASATDCMERLIDIYACENYTREEALDIISIRYTMTFTGFSTSENYVIATNVPMAFVELVEEKSYELEAIEVQYSSTRAYTDPEFAPHILGTIGLISTAEYDQILEDDNTYSADNVHGYSYNDLIGKSGIEQYFEDELRGLNGSVTMTSNELGELESVYNHFPQSGNNVHLTLDNQLQDMLNYSLEKSVEASLMEECVAGAAVVLDIDSFAVLASSSYPSYDIYKYQNDNEYYNNLVTDENIPLFNRAFNGQFTPGSVMKPLVAIAALEESVINAGTTHTCYGSYNYYSDYSMNCIGSHDPGEVDFETAIATSCNSYFADAGRLLGIDAMEVYANLFALGEPTGVEIYESSGVMTNPIEYEYLHGVSYVGGVTPQAAIGQADNMFTPLQLASYVATIANDGVRLETHLLDKITSFDNKEIIEQYEPIIAEDMGLSSYNLDLVQSGMRSVVTDGTAANYFADYGIAVAAKTGTAQNPGKPDSNTFIAYAPYDDPEIAIAVVIEYGDSSNLAKSVAKDVFDAYFYGITAEDKIEEGNLQ